ncbi:MAG: HEAT repeat domain-containing protein [Planctomycetia bacterium]|nr:HEAT repeat domain-containing protein [Planctomycetia bacterium]
MRGAMRLAVVAVLTALPASAGPPTMKELAERLGSDDPEARQAAMEEICGRYEEWGDADLAVLERAGADADAERAAGARRGQAQVRLLRRIGPALVECWTTSGPPDAGDSSTTRRLLEEAAGCWRGGGASDVEVREFLAMIAEAGGDAVAACPVGIVGMSRCRPLAGLLAERLRKRLDEVGPDRAKVIRALGQAGDPAFGSLLDGYVFGPPEVQEACLKAARELKATSAARAIASLSEVGTVKQRVLAVEALGGCATEQEWPALRRRLMDPSPEVRSAAARAVLELRPRGGARWVAPLLKDRDRRVVLSATLACGMLAGPGETGCLFSAAVGSGRRGSYPLGRLLAINRPPGWKERLLAWLDAPDPIRRGIAAEGLRASGARDAGDALLRHSDPGRFEETGDVWYALTQLDPPGVVDRVRALLESPDAAVRSGAAQFANMTRGPRWAPLVTALLDDVSPDVVRAALEAAPAAFDPAMLPKVEKLLAHPDGLVRGAAAACIGKRGSAKHLPQLLALLKDADAAQGAAFGLGDLGEAGAIPGLREVQKGEFPHLRGITARSLALLGSTNEIFDLVKVEEAWWSFHDSFHALPPEGVARIASLAFQVRDRAWQGWPPEAILRMDGGCLAVWDPRDARDFQRRMRNLSTSPEESVRLAALVRLVEWGMAPPGAERLLLEATKRFLVDERWAYALCFSLAAAHEPAWFRAANERRVLKAELVTCGDVEAWAGEAGASLDMAGFSTVRTWRTGRPASLREVLDETLDVSGRAVYVEGGRARIVLVQEALEFWRRRLGR